MKKFTKIAVSVSLGLLGLFIFNSCSTVIPKNVEPVKNFDAQKYLGVWYEIARFDYKFEKNLNNVTANYSLKENGTIKVTNKGYDYVEKEWKESIGEAKFQGDESVASLKVSFFKPIWSGYHVIDLDENYQYALVSGSSTKYLWILSRTTTIPEEIKIRFVEKAKSLGFPTQNLIWVDHSKN